MSLELVRAERHNLKQGGEPATCSILLLTVVGGRCIHDLRGECPLGVSALLPEHPISFTNK